MNSVIPVFAPKRHFICIRSIMREHTTKLLIKLNYHEEGVRVNPVSDSIRSVNDRWEESGMYAANPMSMQNMN